MPVVQLKASQVGAYVQKRAREKLQLARRLAYEIATEAEARAVMATDAADLVDKSQFKRGWGSRKIAKGGEIGNDAPHAAVLEHGRRPMRPGPPFAPIFEWVTRKLFDAYNPAEDEVEAERLAWAIRNHLHVNGMKGHFILRNLEPWMRSEYRRRLRAYLNRV